MKSDYPCVECVVVGMLQANCYLLRLSRTGEGVIIDPGDDGDKIERAIEKTGLRPEAILLTHGHIDHTNAAAYLREKYRSRVICHREDSDMVKSSESLFPGFVRHPCVVDQEVDDDSRVSIGDSWIRILHTPGHTPGSICLMVDNLLFSGDTLFRGSIGRTDLPGGNEQTMMETLRQRILVLKDEIVVYPGHGAPTTIGEEKLHNPFLQLI